ncbi:hypothetical protein A2U01_0070510, partial [Trifolium medium]|nr:hypothetical protein [Trifolium medium]
MKRTKPKNESETGGWKTIAISNGDLRLTHCTFPLAEKTSCGKSCILYGCEGRAKRIKENCIATST